MADDTHAARAARARARQHWPGARLTLDALPDVTPVDAPPEERLGMVRTLTLAAWALSGKPLPDYDRRDAPGRVVRPERDA